MEAFLDEKLFLLLLIQFKKLLKNNKLNLLKHTITIDGTNNKVNVGTGITLDATNGVIQVPDLQVTGTTGTLNPPVMTTTQRDDLDPDTGSLIFNSTSGQLEVWNGTSWAGVGAVNNLTISNL